jgi:arylsulfatase A-like enzyme
MFGRTRVPSRGGASRRVRDPVRLRSAMLPVALATTWTALCGCGGGAPAKPNVILISVDTLRADHLGCYGNPRGTSPNIDRLASEGVLFENGFSPTAWTLPGHASMFTGLTPRRHGATRVKTAIREDVPLLTEILAQAGYATAAVVNAPFLQAKFGFSRGFDAFTYVPKLEVARHQEAVLDTVRRGGKRPFFYFFHYMSVHDPYAPEERFNRFVGSYELPIGVTGQGLLQLWRALDAGERSLNADEIRFLDDLYTGGVLSVDARIGELLDLLKSSRLDDDTIVIFTSDHGEEFMEHGSIVHTKTLYDEVLRVPLILRGPEIPRGARIRSMAALIDIVPTVLGLLDIAIPPGLDGVDLAAYWNDDTNPERALEIETNWINGGRVKRGVRTPTRKLIVSLESGSKEYYDLDRDPAETDNLYPHPGAQELGRELATQLESAAGGEVVLDPEDIEALKALGYL